MGKSFLIPSVMTPKVCLVAVVFIAASAEECDRSSSCATATLVEEFAESVDTSRDYMLLQAKDVVSRMRTADDLGSDGEQDPDGVNFDPPQEAAKYSRLSKLKEALSKEDPHDSNLDPHQKASKYNEYGEELVGLLRYASSTGYVTPSGATTEEYTRGWEHTKEQYPRLFKLKETLKNFPGQPQVASTAASLPPKSDEAAEPAPAEKPVSLQTAPEAVRFHPESVEAAEPAPAAKPKPSRRGVRLYADHPSAKLNGLDYNSEHATFERNLLMVLLLMVILPFLLLSCFCICISGCFERFSGAGNAEDYALSLGTFEFEKDAYSHALVTSLNLHESHRSEQADSYNIHGRLHEHTSSWKMRASTSTLGNIRLTSAILFMVLIWFLQLAIAAGIQTQMMSKRYAFWTTIMSTWQDSQFGNSYVPTRITPEASESICGKYSKVGRLGLFGYIPATGAAWTQNPASWTNGNSMLHTSIRNFTVVSSLFSVPFWVYVTAISAWTCQCLFEIRAACVFGFSLFTLKRTSSVEWVYEEDSMILTGFTVFQKVLSAIIAAMRIAIALYLYAVGCVFLRENLSVTDLILNAVALAFILELDSIFYRGVTLCKTDAFEELARVKYRRPDFIDSFFQSGSNRIHVGGWGALISAAASFVAIFLLSLGQIVVTKQMLQEKFDASAFTCLFLGPAPKLSTRYSALDIQNYESLVFPVPGLCESLTLVDFVKDSNASVTRLDVDGKLTKGQQPKPSHMSSGSYFQGNMCDTMTSPESIKTIATRGTFTAFYNANAINDLIKSCCAMLQWNFNVSVETKSGKAEDKESLETELQDRLKELNDSPDKQCDMFAAAEYWNKTLVGDDGEIPWRWRFECYNKTPQVGEREVNEDAVELNQTDDVAAFWCPRALDWDKFSENKDRVDRHTLLGAFWDWQRQKTRNATSCQSPFELGIPNQWIKSIPENTFFEGYPKGSKAVLDAFTM